MLKELTFKEVEELANTGEWPELVTAVACRKNEPDYASGKRITVFSAIIKDNTIVCVMGFECGYSERSGEVLYIGPLCVHKAYRGQGIGSLAVFAFQVMATSQRLKLLLYAHKDVQGFYQKHRFKAVYEVEEDYQAMEWVPDELDEANREETLDYNLEQLGLK